MSVVCGTMAGAADSNKISNWPVTFEWNRNRPIKSGSFAGPYINVYSPAPPDHRAVGNGDVNLLGKRLVCPAAGAYCRLRN